MNRRMHDPSMHSMRFTLKLVRNNSIFFFFLTNECNRRMYAMDFRLKPMAYDKYRLGNVSNIYGLEWVIAQ